MSLHVAPVAYVQKPDGKQELMVYDPSLFNRPVTVEEWTNRMKETSPEVGTGRVDKIYFGSRFQYKNAYWDQDNRTKWDDAVLENVEETYKKYRPLEDHSAPISQNQKTGGSQQQNSQKQGAQ